MDTKSTDPEIRGAFHHKFLKRHHACNDTLVIDELGLLHAKARVDIAVINGCIHGYEIKSSSDNLSRLPRQIELYGTCLEKLSVVCAENHLSEVLDLVPEWCGVILVEKGRRGGIHFQTISRPKKNKNIKRELLAHLLWRDEARKVLEEIGLPKTKLNKPRKELYKEMALALTEKEITKIIKQFMRAREGWRDHLELGKCGG